MPYASVLVVSDNEAMIGEFIRLLQAQPDLSNGRSFRFACQQNNQALANKDISGYTVEELNIKQECANIIANHDLVISAHCKQLFPKELVEQVKCINIHPGYNPYNRGWYPQVFSIINGQPLGATIHEIDEALDHGKIIDREKVELKSSDTSRSAYDRVQEKEFELLRRNLGKLLDGEYATYPPESEGNVNLKKDFEELREINLDELITFGAAIDRLRALSHPPFKNAYFIDPQTKKRVWIEIALQDEDSNE